MIALIRERSIGAVVDATHPYAVRVRAAAVCAAAATGVCHATFIRPGVFSEVLPEEFNAATCIRRVSSHDEAAAAAFSVCRPVLLTTGSGNLEQYARESSRTGIEFFARVLPHPESIDACRRAGIPDCRIITGRGPFSVEDNRRHIREHDIGVVVTKDSGDAGGAPEKLEAARLEGCLLVVVARPQQPAVNAFEDIPALVTWLSRKRCENGR
jgi:precorrin-6A/cobalt-precorrin-6A reductase